MVKLLLNTFRRMFTIALIVVMPGYGFYAAEEKLLMAEEIIKKNLEVMGGRKAFEKIRNCKIENTITMQRNAMGFDLIIYKERPNKFCSISEMGMMGKLKYGSDSNIAWEISPLSGTRILEGEEQASRLLDNRFDDPHAWDGFYKSAKTDGIEVINDKACYKVVLTPNEGAPRIHYYDKKTFLLIKYVKEARNQGGTYPIETYPEDYRKIDGRLFAHKMTRHVMGQIVDITTVKGIETNINMPDGIFDLPEEIHKLVLKKSENEKIAKIKPDASVVVTTPKSSGGQVDLSPTKWGPAEIEKYDRLNQEYKGENKAIEGENAVIVGTTIPPAQRAGVEALRQGGSAMDAVLTTSLTNIVLNTGAMVSFAGTVDIIYYDASTEQYYNLNAYCNTLLEEDDPMSISTGAGTLKPGDKKSGMGRTVLVPGYMAGLEAAHKRFGKLPFSTLFSPAIYYADKGFALPPYIANWIFARQSVLTRLPETKRIFINKETGYFFGAGDQFCQKDLAATLRAVAKQGAAYIYTGEWAKKLVDAVQQEGGKMTMQDLQNYRPMWTEPLKIPYGEYVIYANGLPSVGGICIAQALNVAHEAGLAKMGHYTNSPKAFFWLFQIYNLDVMTLFSDSYRENLLSGIDASLPSLATKAHAKQLWPMMSKGQFSMTKTPITNDPKHSDAIVAIDRWGNIAALVHSINTFIWGETGIFVDGVSIADSANYQQRQIREAGPGQRLPDGKIPLIISKHGKPLIALASVGSGLHQVTNSVLLNIIDFNMTFKEALNAPSLLYAKYGPQGIRIPQVYEGDFSDELIAGVKELGLEVEVIPETGGAPGWVIGAMIDADGSRKAIPSPRGNGIALGY